MISNKTVPKGGLGAVTGPHCAGKRARVCLQEL